MKSLFILILLISLKVFAGPDPELRYYFLKCPNGQIITSVAVDLEKKSRRVDYGANGRTDFIPWSLEFEHQYKHYEMGSKALERKVTWKEGIHFVPTNLGLPEKMNGCDVVPVVVYFEGIGYVGSTNDYSLLDKYNRLILNLHFDNPKVAEVVFSDKYKILPAREKYFFVKYGINYNTLDDDYGSSFDLKIPVSQNTGSIVDIKDCTWWNENTPQKCDLIQLGTGFFFMKNVEFWKNGIIRIAEIPDYYFWPKDWNNPSGKKVQCGRGSIGYRFNGELDSCVDMKEVP